MSLRPIHERRAFDDATTDARLKHAYETLAFGQNAARVRHDLEDVLGQVRAAGFRPVLVLDDPRSS